MPQHRKNSFMTRAGAFLASRRFFWLITIIFVLEAAWIALSGRYPMAFDEDFHLGIIRLYAHHLSPFWSAQPVSLDIFGGVIRDPSYLYHWLMSFPYRLIVAITPNQAAQILFLRGINIVLFASALPLYRRLLFRTGASRAIVHSCLALFVLIPIAPLLAAQINYDNLFLPLTALVLLLTAAIGEEMKRTQRFNLAKTAILIILLMLTCLVKYAFLPITLVVTIYLAVRCYQTYHSWRKFGLSLSFGFSLISHRHRWLLLGAFLLVTGLFVQRYGVNLALYHKPVPDCSEVLSIERCKSYAPWARDHVLEMAKNEDESSAASSPLVFTGDWFYGMWLRSFFAVDGPGTNFQTRGPLVLPAFGAIFFTSIGFLAAAGYSQRLFRRYNSPVLWLFVSVVAVYALALWFDGYGSFLETGHAVAINGRYLLPVYPLVILLCALGWNELLKGKTTFKLAMVSLALICMLWGGGALTYILRSNNAWYWHNQAVSDTNQAVRRVLGPLTPGYSHPTAFMAWN